MAYTPQTWTNGVSKLNATRLNYIETGIEAAAADADTAQTTADAAIPKAISGFDTDKVPVYDGSDWVAQKLVDAQVDPAAAIAYSKLALTGQIVNADVSASAAIDVGKLAAAFSTYVPTWGASSAPAIGNGTLAGRYLQIGKLVVSVVEFTAGSTTTFGSGAWTFTLPVTARSTFGAMGVCELFDSSSSSVYQAYSRFNSTTSVVLVTAAQPGVFATATAPFTWATSDAAKILVVYEGA